MLASFFWPKKSPLFKKNSKLIDILSHYQSFAFLYFKQQYFCVVCSAYDQVKKSRWNHIKYNRKKVKKWEFVTSVN